MVTQICESFLELLYKLKVRVASLILSFRNGTKDESANNMEHRGHHGGVQLNFTLTVKGSLLYMMPFKYQRIYPLCGKLEVNDISSPLFYVHNLVSANRKTWLKLTKHLTMNTVYKHLISKTKDQPIHPSSVKRSRMSMENMNKQKIASKPKILNEFLYS